MITRVIILRRPSPAGWTEARVKRRARTQRRAAPPYPGIPNSRSASFNDVLRSVDSRRFPMMSAHGTE
jgi:hypothetical protein